MADRFGTAVLVQMATCVPSARAVERLGRLQLDGDTLALTLAHGEDSTVFGLIYLDAWGEYRSRWALKAPPPLPTGGTAVDLRTATLTAAIRESLVTNRTRTALDLALNRGIAYFTDGADGTFEVTIRRDLAGLLDTHKVYSWEFQMTIGGKVLRMAVAEFRARPSEADAQGYDHSVAGRRTLDRHGALTFIGEAPAGTSDATAAWRIRRIAAGVAGETVVQYADGNRDFDNIWANRMGLAYS